MAQLVATQLVNDDSNSHTIFGGMNHVFRTSEGVVYIVTMDLSDGTVSVWKDASGGLGTPVLQDNGNAPSDVDYLGVSAAMDSSEIIHISWMMSDFSDATNRGAWYVAFDTSDDTYGTAEQVWVNPSSTSPAGDSNMKTAIVVDSNDKPHLIATQSYAAKIAAQSPYYSNRISGSWTTPVGPLYQSSGFGDVDSSNFDICIKRDDDVPVITAWNSQAVNITLRALIGNANNATSFTIQKIGSTILKTYVSVDSDEDGNIYVFYGANDNVELIKHIEANSWSSWETAITLSTNLPTGSITGFVLDSNNAICVFRDFDDDDLYLIQCRDSDIYTASNWFQDSIKVGTYTVATVGNGGLNQFPLAADQLLVTFPDGTDVYLGVVLLSDKLTDKGAIRGAMKGVNRGSI